MDPLAILMDTYMAADIELRKAKEDVESATAARSRAVKAFLDANEGRTGPYLVGGSPAKIVCRGETYFFKRSRG